MGALVRPIPTRLLSQTVGIRLNGFLGEGLSPGQFLPAQQPESAIQAGEVHERGRPTPDSEPGGDSVTELPFQPLR